MSDIDLKIKRLQSDIAWMQIDVDKADRFNMKVPMLRSELSAAKSHLQLLELRKCGKPMETSTTYIAT